MSDCIYPNYRGRNVPYAVNYWNVLGMKSPSVRLPPQRQLDAATWKDP